MPRAWREGTKRSAGRKGRRDGKREGGGVQGLAKAVAWDGEGATTLLEVDVTGAADDESAQKVLPACLPTLSRLGRDVATL